MSSNTAWVGSGMSSSERAIGRAAARIWRSTGNTLSIHQRATSGNDSSRRVSPVGAQSTTITSHSPEWWCCLEHQQREQLVHPRRDRQLLGRDPIDAALEQQVAEPLLHARPVALHLLLGLDLLTPQMLGRRQRLRTQLHAERLRQAVGRVGGDHQRPQPAGGAAARGARRDRGLADAPLAGVQDRARPHDRASLRRDVLRDPEQCRRSAPKLPARSVAASRTWYWPALRQRRDRERVHAVGEARAGRRTRSGSRARRRSRRCEIFDSRKRIVERWRDLHADASAASAPAASSGRPGSAAAVVQYDERLGAGAQLLQEAGDELVVAEVVLLAGLVQRPGAGVELRQLGLRLRRCRPRTAAWPGVAAHLRVVVEPDQRLQERVDDVARPGANEYCR